MRTPLTARTRIPGRLAQASDQKRTPRLQRPPGHSRPVTLSTTFVTQNRLFAIPRIRLLTVVLTKFILTPA